MLQFVQDVLIVFTFDRDFGLAELTAGIVGGLAEVIAGVVPGGRADLQTCRPVREADPGAAGRRQVLPVLHPLDLQRGGAADVTPETQLVALVHGHRLERNVKHRRLLGLCRRDDDSFSFQQTVLGSVLRLLHCSESITSKYINQLKN